MLYYGLPASWSPDVEEAIVARAVVGWHWPSCSLPPAGQPWRKPLCSPQRQHQTFCHSVQVPHPTVTLGLQACQPVAGAEDKDRG